MALESNYIPKNFESDIYQKWQKSSVGNPDIQNINNNHTHSILMPPPNLTGDLHAGHAFQHFLMDTLSRHARLNGTKNLWFPGVDHAGLQLEGVIDALIIKGEYDARILKLVEIMDNGEVIKLKDLLKSKKRDNLPSQLKKTIPDLWLTIAWEKVNLWRDNQKMQSSVLGDTPDYSRQLFTLDEKASKMVNFAFREYWEDGLIYKDSYLINWSVGLQTALSDVSGDTDFVTRKDPFLNFIYKLQKISGVKSNYTKSVTDYFTLNPIEVATVRPETIHGDMAVAIHPDILRNNLIEYGLIEFDANRIIHEIQTKDMEVVFGIPELSVNDVKLIISEKVDKSFGTGALKITPGSDIVDFNIWVNDYEGGDFIRSIDKTGLLRESCGSYTNQDRFEARLNIIFDLAKNGYIPLKEGFNNEVFSSKFLFKNYEESVLELKDTLQHFKIDFDYEHNVTICERSKTVVEPLISDEFFIAVKRKSANTGLSLLEHGLEGVSQVNFYPNEYQERGRLFIEGLKDWCISRNLLWGHQFPVWYNIVHNPDKIFYSSQDWNRNKETREKIFIGNETEMANYAKDNNFSLNSWVRDERRLDTWFSSALWPLTTFGFNGYKEGDRDNDFATFYPTSTMVTAKEIFNIWICRMVMLSKYFTSKLASDNRLFNSIPFKDMVVHPTVLDDKGRKMSKSLGNGLDPVDQINKYSSDSLRMAMLSGMIPGRNMRLGGKVADQICEKYRNFGNKVWNIIRFLETKNALNLTIDKEFSPTISGWWLIKRYKEIIKKYDSGFANYELAESVNSIYDFVFNDLAAWHLEYQKVDETDLALTSLIVKDVVLLLSPFMPFESEVIWSNLSSISMASTIRNPELINYFFDQVRVRTEQVEEFSEIIKTIESLRSSKGLFNIPAGESVLYSTTSKCIIENAPFIKMTTKCELDNSIDNNAYYQLTLNTKADLISKIPDKVAEITRTNKQLESINKQLTIIESMLINRDFLDNATPDIIKQKNDDMYARQADIKLLNNKLTLLK